MVFTDWNQERAKLVHNKSLFKPFLHEDSAFLCQNRILRFYNIIYLYYKFDYILHLYIIFYLIIFLICGVYRKKEKNKMKKKNLTDGKKKSVCLAFCVWKMKFFDQQFVFSWSPFLSFVFWKLIIIITKNTNLGFKKK